jgi:hypothetical protein
MGTPVLKNWTPKEIFSFLKANGFEARSGKGDHKVVRNLDKPIMATVIDMGRKSFSVREMGNFVKQTKIPKKRWINWKK